MANSKTIRTGGVDAAAIDAKLPRQFFVMRGHVRDAFGLSEEDMTTLVAAGVFVAEYPVKGGRARFVRSKIVAYARRCERE